MTDRKLTFTVAACVVAYFVILWVTAPAVGFVRDEGYYFKAAQEYGGWWGAVFSSGFFDAFSDAEIKSHFSYNTEHPALVKLTMGFTYRLLHEWLPIASPSQAYRATGFLFGALSLLATFLLGRTLVSAPVGLLAAALMAAMPRYFFDAHLACFDVPVTAMWTLSLWAFWRAYVGERSQVRRLALQAGVIFGLTLATKLNGLFLPFLFVGVWLWTGRLTRGFGLARGPSGGLDLRLPSLPWVLLACAIVGPLVFWAHWPYIWHDTVTRVGAYIGFHMHHEHYPASYFGAVLSKPPFPISFPFVMTLFTVPSPVVLLGALGAIVAAVRAVRDRSGEDTLLLLAVLLPPVLIAMPGTPIFGGVKHWYNALPVLSILAARAGLQGAAAVARWLPSPRRWIASVVVGGAMLAPGVLGIVASHPHGIGFYNELAGGIRGGAALGMQRAFWGGLGHGVLEDVAALPAGSRVFFNRMNYDGYRMYVREGALPSHVYYANHPRGIAAALHFEQPEHGEKEGEIWSTMGTRPVAGVYADNVTLVQLYTREDLRN